MVERSLINDEADVAVDFASGFSKEDAGGSVASGGLAEDFEARKRAN